MHFLSIEARVVELGEGAGGGWGGGVVMGCKCRQLYLNNYKTRKKRTKAKMSLIIIESLIY